MSWETPKTDWTVNPKVPEPTDFNRIEGNIDFLKTDIETKKGLIVDAMNSIDVPASTNNTFAELAAAIAGIDRKKHASGRIDTPTSAGLTISNLEFTPSMVMLISSSYVGLTAYTRFITARHGKRTGRLLVNYTYASNDFVSTGSNVLSTGITLAEDGFSIPASDNAIFTSGDVWNVLWYAYE